MITSAQEFVALRTSDDPAEQSRATYDEAELGVWLTVVDTYPDMRRWVAHNKTVPHEVLERLASDPDPAVRWTVASKRKLDDALLRRLATDADDTVRARVARHHRTSAAMLEAMLEDDAWTVRQAAQEALASRASRGGQA